MNKSLDRKIARILSDRSCKDFILADAKDADMAFGIAAPGHSPEHHAREGRFRSLDEYRELIRENVRQGLVDIMLMSASNNEVLTLHERLFDGSPVTPAIRANDATDVWVAQGGIYLQQPSTPFRSASIDQAMCGKPGCQPQERTLGQISASTRSLSTTTRRWTTARWNIPGVPRGGGGQGLPPFSRGLRSQRPANAAADLARFINDMIVRTLAGVAGKARPLFLKIVYHGPAAMEQLAGYDSQLIVGIMGGSSGTTFDAFQQLWEARKYGARAALYGRMINNSEHQLTFIEHLAAWPTAGSSRKRQCARTMPRCGGCRFAPIAASKKTSPDLRSGDYGSSARAAVPPRQPNRRAGRGPVAENPKPDFSKMTTAEKLAWNRRVGIASSVERNAPAIDSAGGLFWPLALPLA